MKALALKRHARSLCALLLAAALLLLAPPQGEAYAVLSHEAIIDSAWETSVKPLLLQRFPKATAEELREAHGYAYGGAIIQDLGYYPHGSIFFSDLVHYVRAGDFIVALLRDAKDLNEHAFALGALAHYAADTDGHRLAVNRAVPVLYPALREKYGEVVTYEDDKLAHVKTEFGFDVLQVARNRYAPDSYHDFIGFNVAQSLLDRAFCETYGLELQDVLQDEPQTLGSYRRAVSHWIPRATRVAWTLKKKEIKNDVPSITRRKFLYNLSRASYEKEWGKNYQKPGFGDRFLAFLFLLIPKFGPLRVLELRTPTPETERMFQESFNATMDHYRQLLRDWHEGHLTLPNNNFDVGEPTGPGKYAMADDTQARLLDRLAQRGFSDASPEMRWELITYLSDANANYSSKRDPKRWHKVQQDLEQLKAFAGPPAVPSGAQR